MVTHWHQINGPTGVNLNTSDMIRAARREPPVGRHVLQEGRSHAHHTLGLNPLIGIGIRSDRQAAIPRRRRQMRTTHWG
jgi:hypothetical protein